MSRDAGGDLLASGQPPVEPRGRQATNGVHGQGRREELRGVINRKPEREMKTVGGDILHVLDALRLGQGSQRRDGFSRGSRGGPQRAEVPLCCCETLIGSEVANQRENGVVRTVVAAEELCLLYTSDAADE